jgi:hypothetical protein
MKKHYIIKSALAGLVCACSGMIVCALSSSATAAPAATAAASSEGGTLTISRAPSVGSGIFVSISADGKQLTTLSQGKSYRGTLAPGKHLLLLVPDPNLSGQRPFKLEVTVENGKTYSFRATRKSGDIILVRNP